MKKIIWLFLLFFSCFSFVHAEELGDYFIEGENPSMYPVIDQHKKKITAYTTWNKEEVEMKPNRVIEERTVLHYQIPNGVRYIVFSDLESRVSNVDVYYEQVKLETKIEEDENLWIDLGGYFNPEKIKIVVFGGTSYTLSFVQEKNLEEANILYGKHFNTRVEKKEYTIKKLEEKNSSFKDYYVYDGNYTLYPYSYLVEKYTEYRYKDYLYFYVKEESMVTQENSLIIEEQSSKESMEENLKQTLEAYYTLKEEYVKKENEYQEKITAFSKEIENLKKEKESLEEEKNRMQTLEEEKSQTIIELTQEKQQLEAKQVLLEQIRKDETSTFQKKIEEYETKNSAYQKEIETLQASLEEKQNELLLILEEKKEMEEEKDQQLSLLEEKIEQIKEEEKSSFYKPILFSGTCFLALFLFLKSRKKTKIVA